MVITNSIPVIKELERSPYIKIIGIGGVYQFNEQCFVGSIAEEYISRYRVDKAIIGADGFSFEEGVTSHDPENAGVTKLVAENAETVIVAADYTKIGTRGVVPIAPIEKKVAKTIKKLRHSKVGMMGYADMGLYVCMFDGMSLRAKIGPEIEVFDMLEIVQKMEKVSHRDVQDLLEEKKKFWNINPDVREEALVNAIRIYLAIKERIKEGSYNAISIKCVEGMKKYMNFPPCMILTMLSEELPVICEDDALGAVTQLMIHYLTGQSAPYVEMYEFMKDRILVGICGFVPPGATEGKVCVARYAGWGGLSEGAMNVSRMKTGPLTLVRLFSKGDNYKLHIVTGEGLPPRRWEELGWEAPAPFFPSLEIKLDVPVEEFAQKIASQHYFVIYGDHKEEIRDLCKVLNIELV